MVDIDELVCSNCWDVVQGTAKLKTTEFYRIKSKPYCSVVCFYEDYDKEKTPKVENCSQTNESNKKYKKVHKKRSKQKKGKK